MYRIKKTSQFYRGTINAEQQHYLTEQDIKENDDYYYDSDIDILAFNTKKEAQKVIDKMKNGNYYLSHGEAGRPDFEIVDDDDDIIDCYDAAVVFDIDDDYEKIEKKDMPPDILAKLSEGNVSYRYTSETHNCDIYADSIDDDEIEYRVIYAPSHLALQKNSDDFGGLNWSKEAYYKKDL